MAGVSHTLTVDAQDAQVGVLAAASSAPGSRFPQRLLAFLRVEADKSSSPCSITASS